MSQFTPPINPHGVPAVLPEGDPEPSPQMWALFRYYSARPGGDGNNVYYRITSAPGDPEVGEVTDVDPFTTYANGQPLVDGWADVVQVWWAGHAPVDVTAPQATALIAAGYTLT